MELLDTKFVNKRTSEIVQIITYCIDCHSCLKVVHTAEYKIYRSTL